MFDQALWLGRQDGDETQLAFFFHGHVRCAIRRDEQINLSAQQILRNGTAAFVGHMQHFSANFFGQLFANQMIEAAIAHAGVIHGLALLGHLLNVGHHFIGILGRKIFACHDGHGGQGHLLNQAKIFRLVFHGFHGQGRQNQFIGGALKNVVTIRRCTQHFLRCDGTAGAA